MAQHLRPITHKANGFFATSQGGGGYPLPIGPAPAIHSAVDDVLIPIVDGTLERPFRPKV